MAPKAVQVGQTVQYIGRDDIPFAGLVLMTAETYDENRAPHGLVPLTGTQAIVEVTRPKGRKYVATGPAVLEGSKDHDAAKVALADYEAALAKYETDLAEFNTAQSDPELDPAEDADESPAYPVHPGSVPVVRIYRTI
jgi:hypothetical protein